jgi:hypothetical protein
MQNKPNLLNAQMNVNPVKTKNYEQISMNNEPIKQSQKLEAKRRSLRVSFSESTNRGPNKANFGLSFSPQLYVGGFVLIDRIKRIMYYDVFST